MSTHLAWSLVANTLATLALTACDNSYTPGVAHWDVGRSGRPSSSFVPSSPLHSPVFVLRYGSAFAPSPAENSVVYAPVEGYVAFTMFT